MTPLLIRCEATPELGTGHALRCLALAQEWMRRGGRAVFAMSEPEPAIAARLRAAGAAVEPVRAMPGSPADAIETAALAQQLGAQWTVVDGPAFAAEWDAAWAGDPSLLRIDDNGLARPFRAELVLNQNLGAAVADYPVRVGPCRLLLGPGYALMRPEFLDVPEVLRGTRLLVTLGGSDPACATERVLAALGEPAARNLAADFIVGAANPRRAELLASIEAHGPRLHAVVAPDNLPERFAGAEFAVTAGGTTLYELALLRTPMFLLCTAENQRRTCERFAAAGAARFAGWHADIAPAALAQSLAEFAAYAAGRSALAERASTLADGLGAVRVVETMLGGGA
jgi:UDP-2,4-diacetamido-2,4,6-trideoxy-beta-L-altropyranose hydrolase